jgi:hypothetical protein
MSYNPTFMLDDASFDISLTSISIRKIGFTIISKLKSLNPSVAMKYGVLQAAKVVKLLNSYSKARF